MCHPGYSDDELVSKSSYNKVREIELATLCDTRLKNRIRELGIELVSY